MHLQRVIQTIFISTFLDPQTDKTRMHKNKLKTKAPTCSKCDQGAFN